jgi:hypothetical protein
MREKIIKVIDEEGKITFKKCRKLKLGLLKNGNYIFKDAEGNRIVPHDEELAHYNSDQNGPLRIENGWLTLIGILTLIGLIVMILMVATMKG